MPFTIALEIRGNTGVGDTVTLSGGTGHIEDAITLTYNLGDTALNNILEFRNIEQAMEPITEACGGSRQYTVNAQDAINGLVTIIAVFTHYNNIIPDPITFTIPGNNMVTYGDNGNSYTNKIKNNYMGTGAISYSSSNTAVATVNSVGVVTIRKAGSVIISAEKDADEDYAYAFQSYNLTINPKPVTITGLGAADKYHDGITGASVTGMPVINGILTGEDVRISWGTAAFTNSNTGNNITVTFSGWSLIGPNAGNYELTGQPASVRANIMPNYLLSLGDPSALIYANPGNVLSPIETANYTERTATFTITVSGFINDADAENVGLAVSGSNLLFSGYNTIGFATGDTKTFTVTVIMDHTKTFSYSTVTVVINGITDIPAGYEFTGNKKNTLVAVFDGRTTEWAIPLTRANIAAFNVFVTAGTTSDVALALNYKLTEDIIVSDLRTDLGANNNWMAIGKLTNNSESGFGGNFDGQGHTITGLRITSSSDNQGLFGYCRTGMIKNIRLVNCTVSGKDYVGGVAGYDSQNLANNYALNTMTVQYDWNGSTGTNRNINAGLNKNDGADVSSTQYNSQSWWTTASNWSSDDIGAWDFTNVWEWSATKQLPILRGLGGQ